MDREAIERELRRLFRDAAAKPLPDPDLDDEQLAELIRQRANEEDLHRDDDDLKP